MSRKDRKGRVLKTGEMQRGKDGMYVYRFKDEYGKSRELYSKTLNGLREKEKLASKEFFSPLHFSEDQRRVTLNDLFELHMDSITLRDTTRLTYTRAWDTHVRDSVGNMPVIELKPSDLVHFYAKMNRKGYSKSMIKSIHNMIMPSLDIAVLDDLITKNPDKLAYSSQGRPPVVRKPLKREEVEHLLSFAESSAIYKKHIPIMKTALGTAMRGGELLGLTWDDIDFDAGRISVNHQVTYKNGGSGCMPRITVPKTAAGVRVIPMTPDVREALAEQYRINELLGRLKTEEVQGHSGFVFVTCRGLPHQLSSYNSILKNVVNAHNKMELKLAKEEHREPFLLPNVSSHIMRHTACTRMAEEGMDPKVLQYIMGHAHISITQDIYDHITDLERIEKEINRISQKV